ncbi:hypothetical protein EGW08_021765, partial [Elysia chlorotica]
CSGSGCKQRFCCENNNRENCLNPQSWIKTDKACWAIAAASPQTLAVGYWCPGIDLMDLSGRILRRLSSTLHPRSMVMSTDGYLLITTVNNQIAKLKILCDSTIFDKAGLLL